jgi:hypothetical protein
MIFDGVAPASVVIYSTGMEFNSSIGVQNLDGFLFPLGLPVLT